MYYIVPDKMPDNQCLLRDIKQVVIEKFPQLDVQPFDKNKFLVYHPHVQFNFHIYNKCGNMMSKEGFLLKKILDVNYLALCPKGSSWTCVSFEQWVVHETLINLTKFYKANLVDSSTWIWMDDVLNYYLCENYPTFLKYYDSYAIHPGSFFSDGVVNRLLKTLDKDVPYDMHEHFGLSDLAKRIRDPVCAI